MLQWYGRDVGSRLLSVVLAGLSGSFVVLACTGDDPVLTAGGGDGPDGSDVTVPDSGTGPVVPEAPSDGGAVCVTRRMPAADRVKRAEDPEWTGSLTGDGSYDGDDAGATFSTVRAGESATISTRFDDRQTVGRVTVRGRVNFAEDVAASRVAPVAIRVFDGDTEVGHVDLVRATTPGKNDVDVMWAPGAAGPYTVPLVEFPEGIFPAGNAVPFAVSLVGPWATGTTATSDVAGTNGVRVDGGKLGPLPSNESATPALVVAVGITRSEKGSFLVLSDVEVEVCRQAGVQ